MASYEKKKKHLLDTSRAKWENAFWMKQPFTMGVKYVYNNHTNMSMISTMNNPNERPCSFSHLPQGGDTQTSQDTFSPLSK